MIGSTLMSQDRRAILSRDTTFEVEAEQVRIWRSLTSVQIAALVAGASSASRTMALAGLRLRHPELREDELVPRFALLTVGRALACRAYPELGPADDTVP